MCGRSEIQGRRKEDAKCGVVVAASEMEKSFSAFGSIQRRRRLLNFSSPTVLSCCDEDGESINGEANEGCDGSGGREEKKNYDAELPFVKSEK